MTVPDQAAPKKRKSTTAAAVMDTGAAQPQSGGKRGKKSDERGWEDDELRGAVAAYLDMQRKADRGESFVKSQIYTELAAKFNRTAKAFEYRMQNISAVLDTMNRPWVTGLKPAKNMGYRIGAGIERMISEIEGDQNNQSQWFAQQVRAEYKVSNLPRPSGNAKPRKIFGLVAQSERDAKVKAWVLQQAKGRCECCGKPAPFTDDDGFPYLEVHHVHLLADGGSDTVENAAALCPNCHRELHHGMNRAEIREKLYQSIPRLVFE